MSRWIRCLQSQRLGLLMCVWLVLGATGARAANLPSSAVGAKLDPRLLSNALATDAESVPVWVEFADKGEQGPGDLAAALALAESNLSPGARARRIRAKVTPIVDYLDLPIHAPYLDALTARGYQPYGASRWFNRVAVRASGARLLALAELSFVSRIDPVERALPAARPRGELESGPVPPAHESTALRSTSISYGQTASAMGMMNVPAVHDSGYIGTGVLICVLDEGFNYFNKHEALRTQVIPAGRRRDFVEGDGVVVDTVVSPGIFSHGTWTLGCMAGNKVGTYVGSAYGASFALGRTEYSGSETPVELVWWGMGAEWADSLGADILSSSLGYNLFDNPSDNITYSMLDGHTSVISRAAEIAASKGILVVNSAGNDGNNPNVGYKIAAPADVNGDSMLAIGAVNSTGVRAGFSSKGPTFDGRIKPDLSMLGVSVPLVSASGNPNDYTALSGTSFSCPLVAGLAACLMQARPTWPPSLIILALRETASRATNPDTLIGYGIPSGIDALRWIPDTASVPAPTGTLGLALLGPNPMRADAGPARVRFALKPDGGLFAPARLEVMDAQGRHVRTLFAGQVQRDRWTTAAWDGTDDDGRTVRAGVYFVTLHAQGRHATVRLVSLR